MINPSTYEHLGDRLSSAGEDVTLIIGEAVYNMQSALIQSPDSLSQERQKYEKQVKGAVLLWTTQWKKWVGEDLPEAYLLGVKDADATIKTMSSAKSALTTGVNVQQFGNMFLQGTSKAGSTIRKTVKAIGDIVVRNEGFAALGKVHVASAFAYQKEAYDLLKNTGLGILRKADDIYREVAELTRQTLFKEANIITRRTISQNLMERFAQKGVDSIVYANGARYGIDTYSEMVGRTMSSRISQQATFNRFQEHGYDLVRVSKHFNACELCAPYEGRVFSLSGRNKKYPPLSQAISGGLYHPNCLHDTSAYFPGKSQPLETRVDPEAQKLIDEHGYTKAQKMTYNASQRQRGIERNIRNWKKREVFSVDPAEKLLSHNKVLEWQKAQRVHIRENPFLRRKYDRESIAVWNKYRPRLAPKKGGFTFAQMKESTAKLKASGRYSEILGTKAVPQKPPVTTLKPEIITPAEFQRSIQKGMEPMYRGISADIREQVTKYSDDVHMGRQYIPKDDPSGAGTFFAIGKNAEEVATIAVKSRSEGVIIRATLKPNAKVITRFEAERLRDIELKKIISELDDKMAKALAQKDITSAVLYSNEKLALTREGSMYIGNPTVWARQKGYDAVRQHIGNTLSDEIVVLNLNSLRIVDKDIIFSNYKLVPSSGVGKVPISGMIDDTLRTRVGTSVVDKIDDVLDDFISKNPSVKNHLSGIEMKNITDDKALAYYESARKTITLNEEIYAGGYAKIEAHHAHTVMRNMAPKNTTWTHTIYHEQTHALCRELARKNGGDKIFTTVKKQALKDNGLLAKDVGQNLSAYAASDAEEFIAEAFGEFYSSPSPRPLSKTVVKIVQDMLK